MCRCFSRSCCDCGCLCVVDVSAHRVEFSGIAFVDCGCLCVCRVSAGVVVIVDVPVVVDVQEQCCDVEVSVVVDVSGEVV